VKRIFSPQASSYVRIFKRRLLNPESLSGKKSPPPPETTSFLPRYRPTKRHIIFTRRANALMSSAVRRSARQLASSVSRASSFAAAPVSVESTSSFGLKKLLFSKVPSSGIASALNQQRAAAPGSVRSFQTTAMSAMSNKCVQLPFIAQRVSYHISELWNLLPSVKTKEEYATRAPFFSPIVYLNFARSRLWFSQREAKSLAACLPVFSLVRAAAEKKLELSSFLKADALSLLFS